MKKRMLFILMTAVVCLLLGTGVFAMKACADRVSGTQDTYREPFYGIWCLATKDEAEAWDFARDLIDQGYPANVYLTSDWTNLNAEPWYAVSATQCYREDIAESSLKFIRRICSDAYIKWTGEYAPAGGSDLARVSFYGIWCLATKDLSEAWDFANALQDKGYPANVYLTSEWSNLNREPWYAVSVGQYTSESEANSSLDWVWQECSDAYVKWSGTYLGTAH